MTLDDAQDDVMKAASIYGDACCGCKTGQDLGARWAWIELGLSLDRCVTEQVAEYKQDAERYRWLLLQHTIADPRARIVLISRESLRMSLDELGSHIDAEIRAR